MVSEENIQYLIIPNLIYFSTRAKTHPMKKYITHMLETLTETYKLIFELMSTSCESETLILLVK